jgi:hypothetical protein
MSVVKPAEEIKEFIFSLRLKKLTRENYWGRLEGLRRYMGYEDYSFLDDPDKTIKAIESKTPSIYSHRGLLSVILRVIDPLKKETSNKIVGKYSDKIKEILAAIEKKQEEGIPTCKELDNYIPWAKLADKTQRLYDAVSFDFVKYKKTNMRRFNRGLVDYSKRFYVWYLTHTPPTRNEGYAATFNDESNPNRFMVDEEKEQVIYHIEDFKGSTWKGAQDIILSPKVSKEVIKYFNLLRNEVEPAGGKYYFFSNFVNGEQRPFKTKPGYRSYITNIFKIFTEKPIRNTDLRKSYTCALISNPRYSKLTRDQQRLFHRKALHGRPVAHKIYSKSYETDKKAFDEMKEIFGITE